MVAGRHVGFHAKREVFEETRSTREEGIKWETRSSKLDIAGSKIPIPCYGEHSCVGLFFKKILFH